MGYRVLILYFCLIISAPVVFAEYYGPQIDPDIAVWYHSLKTPNDVGNLPPGISCCDQSDCKPRQVEYRSDGIYAWIEEINDWRILPPDARITDQDVIDKNPFLQAVVCYIPVRGVICWIMNTGI